MQESQVASGCAGISTTQPSSCAKETFRYVKLERIPTSLKDLYETKLLEGLNVQYIHGHKVKELSNLFIFSLMRFITLYNPNIFGGNNP